MTTEPHVPAPSPHTGPGLLGDEREQALALLERGDAAGAGELLWRWCAVHADDEAAWSALGRSEQQQGRHEAARVALERALEQSPDHAGNQMLLATSCFALGAHEPALDRMRHAVHLSGHAAAFRFELYYHNALALHAGGFGPAATLSALKAARFAESAEALTRIGEALLGWGQLAEAESLAADATSRDPYHGRACYLRGQVLVAQRRPYEAVGWIVKAITTSPGFVDPALALAGIFESGGHLHKALEALTSYPADDLSPGSRDRLDAEISRLQLLVQAG